jgi:hypothetical protein
MQDLGGDDDPSHPSDVRRRETSNEAQASIPLTDEQAAENLQNLRLHVNKPQDFEATLLRE